MEELESLRKSIEAFEGQYTEKELEKMIKPKQIRKQALALVMEDKSLFKFYPLRCKGLFWNLSCVYFSQNSYGYSLKNTLVRTQNSSFSLTKTKLKQALRLNLK